MPINKLAESMLEVGGGSSYPPANIDALNQVGQSVGLPTWNGAAWPSGAVPGAVGSLTFFNGIRVNEVSTQALKLTAGFISALNGINGSDSKNAIVGVRDARGTSGVGTAGFVNATIGAFAHSSGVQASSEWVVTAVGNNYSTAGDCGVVGVYGQSNNLASGVLPGVGGYGGVWGGCFEACDMTYGAETNRAIIGAEVDAWVSGNQQNAVGLLVVTNDSKLIRTGVASADKRARHGILVGANNGAKWKIGIEIQGYCEEGLLIYPAGTYGYTGIDAAQAIRIQGKHTHSLINLRFAEAARGIVLNESVTLSTNIAIDIGATHTIAVNGTKVLGARRRKWGWATAANIENDRTGGNAFYRFDPNTDFQFIAETSIIANAADLATLRTYVALLYKFVGAFITDFGDATNSLGAETGHGLIGRT